MSSVITCLKCESAVPLARCANPLCGRPVDVDQIRVAIRRTLEQLDAEKRTRADGLLACEQRTTEILDSMEALRRQIRQTFEGYQQQLVAKQTELMAEVAQLQQTLLHPVDEFIDQRKNEINKVNQRTKSVGGKLKDAGLNVDEAATILDESRELLERIRQRAGSHLPPTKTVAFITQTDDVTSFISGLGCLVEDASTRRYSQLSGSQARIGKRGTREGEFNAPLGMALHNGRLYVVDARNHRIQVFNIDGEFLSAFGTLGARPGEFDVPIDIAISSQGLLIVTDKNNHRVQILEQNGRHWRTLGGHGSDYGEFIQPQGVACDNDFVYVCDTVNHRIQMLTLDDRYVRCYAHKQLAIPLFVAITKTKNVVVTDVHNDKVHVFSQAGDLLHSFGDSGSVPGQLNLPSGVLVDGRGYILVANSFNHRLDVFSEDGKFVCSVGRKGGGQGEFYEPFGLALLPDQKLAVSDRYLHRVHIFELR